MREFLLNFNNNYSITLFSAPHIGLMLITFLLLIFVIYNKNRLKDLSTKTKKIIRYTFGFILLLNMTIRRGSFIYYGVYDWHYHLDINFCNFTSILFMIYCFTGNKKILNVCYHMAFIGPLLAIILPSYNLVPLGYSFYSFIIIHHLLFVFGFIFLFFEEIDWNKKQMIKVIEFLSIYYSVIFVFDHCFNVTYNYPLTFVNASITKISFISYLANNNIIVFIIYFIVLFSLLLLGNITLKKLTKKII